MPLAFRVGAIGALAVWLAGVSGLFGPVVNWTALVIGLALLALTRAVAGPD